MDKMLARSTHLIPLLIGTLNPPAYSFAFDKVTDKARDKVASLTLSNRPAGAVARLNPEPCHLNPTVGCR